MAWVQYKICKKTNRAHSFKQVKFIVIYDNLNPAMGLSELYHGFAFTCFIFFGEDQFGKFYTNRADVGP